MSTFGSHPDECIFVIVLNWNGWQDTLACLDSLKRLDYDPTRMRILVVDNASTDGSVGRIREAHPNVRVVETGANLGYAGGNNVGIRIALEDGADWIWILNNDTEVDPASLAHMVERVRNAPKAGMCGCTLVYHYDRRTVQAHGGGTYDPWRGTSRHIGEGLDREVPVDREAVEKSMSYVNGASMFVSRHLIEKIGAMTEDFFLFYEELDWAVRARGHFDLVFAPDAIVYHKEGAAVGAGRERAEKSVLADFYALRNRLAFTDRHHPRKLPFVRLLMLGVILNRIRRRQWARIPWIVRLAVMRRPLLATPDHLHVCR